MSFWDRLLNTAKTALKVEVGTALPAGTNNIGTVNTLATGASPTTVIATIANGQTVSGAVDMGDLTACSLETPGELTGTTISFQHSRDNATFLPVYDEAGALVTVVVDVSQSVSLGNVIQHLLGKRYLKLVSGSAEGGERSIVIVGRGL